MHAYQARAAPITRPLAPPPELCSCRTPRLPIPSPSFQSHLHAYPVSLHLLCPPQILSNFGNDVLEALGGTCTQWLAGKKRWWAVAADAGVAWGIVTLHALTLMCQVRWGSAVGWCRDKG